MINLLRRFSAYLLILTFFTACLGKLPGAGMEHYAASNANVDTTCVAYTNFTTANGSVPSLQSRIYSSCQTCHNPMGGAGAAMYVISGPNPTDDQLVANYVQARGRMLFTTPDDPALSDLIQYGRGYKSHTGGAAFNLDDELALTNWAADLSTCSDVVPAATPATP